MFRLRRVDTLRRASGVRKRVATPLKMIKMTSHAGIFRLFLRDTDMATNTQPATIILRRKDIEARTGLSRSMIYAKTQFNPKRPNEFDASFPKPVKIGARAVGWIESEIDIWIASRIQQSRAG